MERDLKRLGIHFSLFIAILFALAACSEERPQKLPDAEAERVFSISEVKGTVAQVVLATSPNGNYASAGFRNTTALERYDVVSVSGAGRLAPLFEGLVLPGQSGESFAVKFDINEYVVTAYRELEPAEQDAFTKSIVGADGRLVLFTVRLQRVGRLVQRKNSLDEDSHVQRLQDSSWNVATHVDFNMSPNNRTLVGLDARDEEKTFHVSELGEKVYSRTEFFEAFQVPIQDEDGNGLFVAKINGSQVNIYKVLSKDDPKVSASELRALGQTEELLECGSAAKLAIRETGVSEANCVLKLSQTVKVQFVAFEGQAINNDNRFRSAKLRTVRVDANAGNGFFQIPVPMPQGYAGGNTCSFDPKETIDVDSVRGQEFLFRRTLQDTPNRFPLAFVGLGGKLEIVKFVFEENRVYVRRNRPLSPGENLTEVDLENLISLNAKYYRVNYTDETGQTLETPRCTEANHNEPGVVAQIDWTKNEFPVVASPLSYYWIGQCFARQGPQEVKDVDYRLQNKGGVLNFTLESNYSLNPWIRCTNQWLVSGFAEHWFPTQANFTFRERISFKRHDGKTDNLVLSDVPYYAQKKLNYGVFTFDKNVPNEFGNVGDEGTKQALPMLHPFQIGKKVTYVLKGIPESGTLREKLIAATEEVVSDWNKTLKRSFKHTPLETEENLIDLLVEGRDAGATGELGDLDKNYIYYVEKSLGYWLLGMAGPSPNPRSGTIENSNVMIYGGNMKSYLEYAIKMAKAKAEYEENIKPIKAEPRSARADAGITGGPPGSTSGERASSDDGLSAEGQREESWATVLAREPSVATDLSPMSEYLEAEAKSVDAIVQSLTENYGVSLESPMGTSAGLAGSFESDIISDALNRHSLMNESMFALANKETRPTLELIRKIYEKSVEVGALTDSERLKPIVNSAVVEHFKELGGLSDFEQQQLEADAAKENFLNDIVNAVNAGPATIESIEMGHGVNLLEGSVEDALVDSYRKTLAHEIGHALGLRHNFFASYDDKNWIFEDESLKKRRIMPLRDRKKFYIRNYSSVMDYMPNSDIKYEGPGPWDAYALRAAYTGYLEVDKGFGQALSILNGEEVLDPILDKPVKIDTIKAHKRKLAEAASANGVKLKGGNLIHYSDYLKQNNVNSWLDVRKSNLRKVPLLDIMYCSDESVFLYPECNRHDIGTNSEEIVEYMANQYNAYYSLRNFANDRVDFSWWRVRNYIWRTFYTFARIRHFLDATGFEINKDKEDISRSKTAIPIAAQRVSAGAALAANFFHSVVRTPEASIFSVPEDRFGEAEIADGRILKFEKKWTRDIAIPDSRGQISIRGIEIDKAIALLFLTVRRLGIPEYEQAKVRIAFPNLEQAMYPHLEKKELPTIKLLKNILSNNLRPAFLGPKGDLHEIHSKSVRTHMTELNRFYAAWGAVWALDTYSLEAEANFGALFRIGSSVGENSSFDLPVLTQLGESPKSFGSMKYWLFDRAYSAEEIFNSAAYTRIALKNVARFTNPIADYFNLQLKRALTDKRLEEINTAVEAEAVFAGEEVPADSTTIDRAIDGDSTFNKDLLAERLRLKKEAIKEALAEIPEGMGTKAPDAFTGYMFRQVEVAKDLHLARLELDINDEDAMNAYITQLEAARAYNDQIIKDDPLYAFAQQALLGNSVWLPSEISRVLRIIINPIGQDMHFGYTFDNMQFLNILFYYRHPEYAR